MYPVCLFIDLQDINIIIKSIELSLSWEAASRSATQEFPNILWNPKFHCRVHKGPLLFPVSSQINSFHNTPSYFSSIHLNIILSPTSRSS
jgi:hypothetical protein